MPPSFACASSPELSTRIGTRCTQRRGSDITQPLGVTRLNPDFDRLYGPLAAGGVRPAFFASHYCDNLSFLRAALAAANEC